MTWSLTSAPPSIATEELVWMLAMTSSVGASLVSAASTATLK